MTLANQITLFRVFMIPVFSVLVYAYSHEREWARWAALTVYFLAGLSDLLDGYIARKFNQHSKLGMRLDPLADKLIVNLGFVFIAANPAFYEDMLPAWFMWVPVLILSRDVTIVVGSLAITTRVGPTRFQPRRLGKYTTFAQMSTIIAILLKLPIADYFIFATLILTTASFADYLYSGTRYALSRKAA